MLRPATGENFVLRPTNGKLLFLLELAIIFAGSGQKFCCDRRAARIFATTRLRVKFFVGDHFVLELVKIFVATGNNFCYDSAMTSLFFFWNCQSFLLGPLRIFVATGEFFVAEYLWRFFCGDAELRRGTGHSWPPPSFHVFA